LLAALLLASGISGYVIRVALGKLYDAEKKNRKTTPGNLRFDAAKRHVVQEYETWKTNHEG